MTSNTQLMRTWRRLRKDKLVVIGIVLVAVLTVAAVWPEPALPYNPARSNIALRLQPPAFAGGNWDHVLGTDNLGRDIFSRIMAGAKVSLFIAFASVLVSALLGVSLGLAAGYFGGWRDSLIMRVVDIQLSFPLLLLIIAIVAVVGSSIPILILLFGLSGWAQYARLVRAEAIRIRNLAYVEATHALGNGHLGTMLKHVLPNATTTIVVVGTFELARVLLLESAISFLGLGVQPPTPSWGTMIADGRNYLYNGWWVSTLPGVCIVLAVLAFSFLGDGLRDALDRQSL